MSSSPKLLRDGDETPAEVVRLRREIAGLEQELRQAKQEAVDAKQSAADALAAIRFLRNSPLEPIHKALKMIFGEISRVDAAAASPEPGSATSPHASGLNARWQMIRDRLGGRQAEFIDLLQHGPMTASQLSAAGHCRLRGAQDAIQKMKASGLLTQSGKYYSLREP